MYYEIKHSGIKGQKWGVRKYQNPDGTLTPEGKIRYKGFKGSIRKRIDSGENARQVIRGEQIEVSKKAAKGVGAGIGAHVLGGAVAALGSVTLNLPVAALGGTIVAAGMVSMGAATVSQISKDMALAEIANEYNLADADINVRK